MDCCETGNIYDLTGTKVAAHDLKRYRKNGPDRTTKLLLDALKNQDVEGMSLLDIGGGVGTIQHELLKAGVESVVSVEPSEAYNEAAAKEAKRQGHRERISQLAGDFVELANETPRSDIVILDRVICCYTNMLSLVSQSSARAKHFYGVVYPRDHFLGKILLVLANFFYWLMRSAYREILHSPTEVDRLIRKAGLKPFFDQETMIWKVVVYRR